jgi:uncharacterized protein (TIGR02284 family)
MQTNEKLNEVLNDLVRINNDRITGYEKAADETKDIELDLKAIFHKMADESRKYVSKLNGEISKYGGEHVEGSCMDGCKSNIYRSR